jgi:protoheme IX farnesyltransferase
VDLPAVESPPVAVSFAVEADWWSQARRHVTTYVALTKPRIIELLLVTTVPAVVLAARGRPSLGVLVATLVGGTFAAGAANALNCYLDRDIDARMRRTARRPLVRPVDTVQPVRALTFGLVLAVVATVWLAVLVRPLAAALADGAIAFYVLVYTVGLKRRTPENIVIGGAAGVFPVLVGWAAVTGRVGWPAIAMAGVVLLWTPPHFWALAIRFREDYAAAGVPMAPVVWSGRRVAVETLVYAWATVACSLAVAITVPVGWWYLVPAGVLAVPFLLESHRLAGRLRRGEPPRSMRLFHYSIGYLGLLFLVLALVGVAFRR